MLVFCICVIIMGMIIIIRARGLDYDTKDYREFCDNKYETIFTFFLVIGSIGLVIGIVAAIMALGGSSITLLVVIILFAVAIVCQIVLASQMGVQLKLAKQKIHEGMALGTRTYYGLPQSHPDMDIMQAGLQCCGYIDHDDYNPSKCRPDTCCAEARYLECSTSYSDLNEGGCRKALDRQLRMGKVEYLVELLILLLLELGVLIMAILIIKRSKKLEKGDKGD